MLEVDYGFTANLLVDAACSIRNRTRTNEARKPVVKANLA